MEYSNLDITIIFLLGIFLSNIDRIIRIILKEVNN